MVEQNCMFSNMQQSSYGSVSHGYLFNIKLFVELALGKKQRHEKNSIKPLGDRHGRMGVLAAGC
jgi:hypothetical protein